MCFVFTETGAGVSFKQLIAVAGGVKIQTAFFREDGLDGGGFDGGLDRGLDDEFSQGLLLLGVSADENKVVEKLHNLK